MTKVTYYMYSCDTCCMSREKMRWTAWIVPSVKNKEKRDIDGIYGKFNENKDKRIVSYSPNEERDAVGWNFLF